MQDIKIRKSLANLATSIIKTIEFRKLTKGLTEGDYRFVSIESELYLASKKTTYGAVIETWEQRPKEIYFTAHLTPLAVNPHKYGNFISKWLRFAENGRWTIYELDSESYNFVKFNYIDRNIDYLAYLITDVKEVSNEIIHSGK